MAKTKPRETAPPTDADPVTEYDAQPVPEFEASLADFLLENADANSEYTCKVFRSYRPPGGREHCSYLTEFATQVPSYEQLRQLLGFVKLRRIPQYQTYNYLNEEIVPLLREKQRYMVSFVILY